MDVIRFGKSDRIGAERGPEVIEHADPAHQVGSLIRVLRQIAGISAAENLVENNDGKNDERNQRARPERARWKIFRFASRDFYRTFTTTVQYTPAARH